MKAREKFIKSIESFARRGWWMSKCEHEGNVELFFYLSFHVHPDDAPKTKKAIKNAITDNKLKVDWRFKETEPGRFFLNPKGLSDIDNLEFNKNDIEIAEKANQDLFRIAEVIRND